MGYTPSAFLTFSTGQFHLMFRQHWHYEEFPYYRISVASFDELLGSVCDVIKEYDTVVRKSMEQPERLVI